MKSAIQLVSTDFDGTIVDWDHPPHFSRDFFDAMDALQRSGGVWAINTGRSIPQVEQGLVDLNFPVMPDYLITLERAVHRRGEGGWEDFGEWNARCAQAHRRLYEEAIVLYREIEHYARKQRGLMAPQIDGVLDGLIAVNEAQMDDAVEFLRTLQPRMPNLNFQRNGIYLRLCHLDYHKGSALAELGRLLEIEREATFAAGDNFNDLPMLDGIAARWVACPANSIPEVKEIVAAAGGYLAKGRAGNGIAEALAAFPWL